MSPRIGLDRQMVLEAAAEMADTDGLERVTMASLARKLGIRSPSLYNHINGLQDLRKKLAVYGLEQLYTQISREVGGHRGDDAIRAFGRAYVQFVREHPGLYEATVRAPGPGEEEIGRAGEVIVNLAVRLLEDFRLDRGTTLHAVRGLRSFLHGFASIEQQQGFGLPLDPDVTFRFLMDTFLAGLRQRKQDG